MIGMKLLGTMVLTAIAPIVWGSTYIVTTELLPANSPLIAATLRALPAGLVLVLLTRKRPVAVWWLKLMVLGFLNIGFFFYCLFFAASHLPGGMAALVMSIQPILVMAFGYLLLSSTLSVKQMSASVVAIGSIGLLVLNNQADLSLIGVIMGVLGAVSMALGVVMTKRWGRPEGMSLLNFTGWQLLFGGVMLLPVALWLEGMPTQLNINNIIGYSYLTVIGAMLAYTLWFYGVDKLPAITLSFLGFLSSISAVLLGYVFLDQTLSWLQGVGAFGVLISIILSIPKADNRQKIQQNDSMKSSINIPNKPASIKRGLVKRALIKRAVVKQS